MDVRINTFNVEQTQLLFDFLVQNVPFISSNEQIIQFLNQKRIFVNDLLIDNNLSCQASDVVSIHTLLEHEPYANLSYKIISTKDDLIVVDKPPFLQVHPAGKYYHKTLTQLLQKTFPVLHPVNRLDKETSGLVLLTTNSILSNKLRKLFLSRNIKKTYFAIIYGVPKQQEYTITAPLVSSTFGKIRNHILSSSVGLPAKTHIKVLKSNAQKTYSLVEITPITGRKHQIRVHLQHIGHPIVGDKQYAFHPELISEFVNDYEGTIEKSTDLLGANRHLLHCSSLSFTHPFTKEVLSYTASLPDDMTLFLEKQGF